MIFDAEKNSSKSNGIVKKTIKIERPTIYDGK